MEKYKNFEVILRTAWGDFLLSDATLELPKNKYSDILSDDDNTRHAICNNIILKWKRQSVEYSPGAATELMCLGYAIWGDIHRFIKWNKQNDERHQIKIETLQLHQVILEPHINKVQLRWLFNDGRTLNGLPNTLRDLAVCDGVTATWPDDEFTVYF